MENYNYYPQLNHAQTPYGNYYPEHLHTHLIDMHDKCVFHLQKKVKLVTVDQKEYVGIIENVDNNHVYLLLEDMGLKRESAEHRYTPFGYGYPGFGYPGFGYPGFGYPGFGPGYGGAAGRLILPLAALTAIAAI